jgi:hypothetical protein
MRLVPTSPSGRPVKPGLRGPVREGAGDRWQITLIAIGAALLAATVAVLLDRARTTRRNAVTAAT